MTGRDGFIVVIRAFGAYFIYQALFGAVTLLAVACGFDFHLRNAAPTDGFCYLCYLLLGGAVIAWAERLASLVYRERVDED